MALDIKAVAKNPKLLIIVGVGVVGGVFFIGRLKPKESSAPVELTPDIRTVVDQSTLQREDENAQKLANLMREREELEERSRQQTLAYQTQLDSVTGQFSSERDEFNTRLQQQAASLGSQFDSIRQGLDAQIKALQQQIASATQAPAIQPSTSPFSQTPNTTTPNTTTPNTQPSQPSGGVSGGTPTQTSEKLAYPGLGENYRMNCDGKPRVLIFRTFDEVVANQRTKMLSSTSLARNCTAIAITGSTRWEVLGWDKLENEQWRGWVNQTRVAWGLYPLTYDEMGRLQYLMKNLAPNGEAAASFSNLSLARAIWDKYNLPYQCGGSIARTGVR